MLMVKAGPAVDALIDQLVPLLEPGDIIIDGGNTHFADTERRTADKIVHDPCAIFAQMDMGVVDRRHDGSAGNVDDVRASRDFHRAPGIKVAPWKTVAVLTGAGAGAASCSAVCCCPQAERLRPIIAAAAVTFIRRIAPSQFVFEPV